jgi:hypothetical protein
VSPDPTVVAAIEALDSDPEIRATAAAPEGLPNGWSERLGFHGAVHRGDLATAQSLLVAATSGEPDLNDPLGQDSDSGLAFNAPFYDPLRLEALADYHVLAARRIVADVPGLDDAASNMATRFAVGPLANLPVSEPADASTSAPESLLFFGSTWMGPADLMATPDASEEALLTRVRARLPAWFGEEPTGEAIDKELRAVEALELRFGEALGAGMASDLNAPRLYRDAILRRRMLELSDSHPTLALRLGRRSLDVTPGALGGASNSSRTRVSFRNDRAFLLQLARQLWLAGQPGEALDLVHPLAQEDRALQPVVHYLGQLDAANSVGTAGKASQL